MSLFSLHELSWNTKSLISFNWIFSSCWHKSSCWYKEIINWCSNFNNLVCFIFCSLLNHIVSIDVIAFLLLLLLCSWKTLISDSHLSTSWWYILTVASSSHLTHQNLLRDVIHTFSYSMLNSNSWRLQI